MTTTIDEEPSARPGAHRVVIRKLSAGQPVEPPRPRPDLTTEAGQVVEAVLALEQNEWVEASLRGEDASAAELEDALRATAKRLGVRLVTRVTAGRLYVRRAVLPRKPSLPGGGGLTRCFTLTPLHLRMIGIWERQHDCRNASVALRQMIEHAAGDLHAAAQHEGGA